MKRSPPERLAHPDKYSWAILYEYLLRPREKYLGYVYVFVIYFWSCFYHNERNCINTSSNQDLWFKRSSLECLVTGSSLIQRKIKFSLSYHSLSFVVTCCTTRCHSLYHSPVFFYQWSLNTYWIFGRFLSSKLCFKRCFSSKIFWSSYVFSSKLYHFFWKLVKIKLDLCFSHDEITVSITMKRFFGAA